MNREKLTELHNITAIANLVSITQHGIVCHHRAKNLGGISIALEEIQARRVDKRVPGGLLLHDYACLYFNARNPMLYRRLSHDLSLCVLSVRPEILDVPGVVITDQNAAGDWVRFAAAPEGISIVREDLTFAERWTHPDDQREEWRHKAAMCAEVLVPECVPSSFITGAYVSGSVPQQRVVALGLGVVTTINARLFFR
jgi:hypothetical protein